MFGGFKATLNLLGGNRKDESSELSSDMSVTGAYRINKEDLYGYSTQDPLRQRPSKQLPPPLRPAKSTSNLVLPKTTDPNLRKSTPAISSDPRGEEQPDRNSVPSRKETKNHGKEQKKLEKQRLADQKKQAQEQAKREKLLKEQAKKEAKKAKAGKNVKKAQTAPIPPTLPMTQNQPNITPRNQPQAQPSQTSNYAPQPAYTTNTLDSSISRSSGPPPYSEVPKSETAPSSKDKSGNVVYRKPVDTGSWDIISQHREQISRPTTAASRDKGKQMVMDLNYNFGATNDNKENSDA